MPASAARAWTIMGASVLYILLLEPLGYIITTPLYVVLALKTMRMKAWSGPILTAIIYTAVTYIVFAIYMRVNLPVGPFTELFRAYHIGR